jgi:AraC-like DNA-binding protein
MGLEFATGLPDPRLRRMLRPYAGYVERTPGRLVRAEYPHPNVVLILSFGPPIEFPELDDARPGSFTGGLGTEPVLTAHDGFQQGIQIDLSPPLAAMVLDLPLSEVTNQVVELSEIVGLEGRELPERLYDAPDWPSRFALVDGWLLRRMADADRPAPAVVGTWARLVESNGRASIGDLAYELGWSRRHLSAQFTQAVGLPPKTYARILRFQHARDLIAGGDGATLAQVALDAGYYDQAHLNRDFREFAHAPPTDLPFVQDEPARAA